jgi:hypothetical protein
MGPRRGTGHALLEAWSGRVAAVKRRYKRRVVSALKKPWACLARRTRCSVCCLQHGRLTCHVAHTTFCTFTSTAFCHTPLPGYAPCTPQRVGTRVRIRRTVRKTRSCGFAYRQLGWIVLGPTRQRFRLCLCLRLRLCFVVAFWRTCLRYVTPSLQLPDQQPSTGTRDRLHRRRLHRRPLHRRPRS